MVSLCAQNQLKVAFFLADCPAQREANRQRRDHPPEFCEQQVAAVFCQKRCRNILCFLATKSYPATFLMQKRGDFFFFFCSKVLRPVERVKISDTCGFTPWHNPAQPRCQLWQRCCLWLPGSISGSFCFVLFCSFFNLKWIRMFEADPYPETSLVFLHLQRSWDSLWNAR